MFGNMIKEDANVEEYVPYFVQLNTHRDLPLQCPMYFTGYLVNRSGSHFYFERDDNRMLLIVPHRDIEYMFPDKKKLLEYYQSGCDSNAK